MATLTTTLVSPQEYLEFEETSEERHEYIDGIIRPMPGEIIQHNDRVGHIYSLIRPSAVKQKCRMIFESVKLWIPNTNRYYYPDVAVSCDARDNEDKSLRHPCFIVEVFSPSTRLTDRREKLQAYQTIETLQGYLMVDHEKKYVEYLERTPTDWMLTKLESGELKATCLQTTFKLEDIFA
jgi:Uma2 family endonuclease